MLVVEVDIHMVQVVEQEVQVVVEIAIIFQIIMEQQI